MTYFEQLKPSLLSGLVLALFFSAGCGGNSSTNTPPVTTNPEPPPTAPAALIGVSNTLKVSTAAHFSTPNASTPHALMPARLAPAVEPPVPVAITTVALPIGKINGLIEDDTNVDKFSPPLEGEPVRVHGVVTQLLDWKTREGDVRRGFFLQNAPDQADGNPKTSDGVFVFAFDGADIEEYELQVGDEVHLVGKVHVHYKQTEVIDPMIIKHVTVDQRKKLGITPFIANPPSDKKEARIYWKRHAGMFCRVPAKSVVQGSPKTDFWSGDTILYVMSADHPVAKRKKIGERRVFRDYHPLDDDTQNMFDNQNGYLVPISGYALDGKFPSTRTFDTLDALEGAVRYHYGEFKVLASVPPVITRGPDPASVSPVPKPAKDSLTVASFNVENLYDMVNDPDDGCDAHDDPGCDGVRRPFNYLPESQAVYDARVALIASQLIESLHGPDIVMFQELEDQDVDKDGKNDAMENLAEAVRKQGGPDYDTAIDRDGTDARGIISGFMFKRERVKLPTVTKKDPIFGSKPDCGFPHDLLPLCNEVSNPKSFNATFPVGNNKEAKTEDVFSRSLQAVKFEVAGETVVLLNNHFSSGPDRRIQKRQMQAKLNASIAESIMKADPTALVIAGGDLNVFPRPDEPLPDNKSDQLGALYDCGLTNLQDDLLERAPESAFTYVYKGVAGTLDHIFVSPALQKRVRNFSIAHINTDFSDGAGDHDPLLAEFEWPEK